MLPHVVISGPAGAGKTTLATGLVSPLKAVCLSKDLLKEWLHEALPARSQDDSLALSGAAMRLIFRIASTGGSAAVMEANWKPELDLPKLRELRRGLVQIYCTAPVDILRRRLADRVRDGRRHPVHRDSMAPEVLAQMLDAAAMPHGPLDLDVPLLVIDTAGRVDIAAIADWVGKHEPDARPG